MGEEERKAYFVMSLPQSTHSPPNCIPCLQASMTTATGLSFAFLSEMTSPTLIFHTSTVPSIAESHVPNLVSPLASGVFGR